MQFYIGIVAYNSQDFISRALNSILDQTYKGNITAVVYNNGSTDDTGYIMLKLLNMWASFSNRKLIYLSSNVGNMGVAAGSQILDRVMQDTSEEKAFFAWLGANDFFKRDFIKKLNAQVQQTEADLVLYGFRKVAPINQNNYGDPGKTPKASQKIIDFILRRPQQKSSMVDFVENRKNLLLFKTSVYLKAFSIDLLRKNPEEINVAGNFGTDLLLHLLLLRASAITALPDNPYICYVDNSACKWDLQLFTDFANDMIRLMNAITQDELSQYRDQLAEFFRTKLSFYYEKIRAIDEQEAYTAFGCSKDGFLKITTDFKNETGKLLWQIATGVKEKVKASEISFTEKPIIFDMKALFIAAYQEEDRVEIDRS